MPDPHVFRPTVQATGLLQRARQWEAETGTPWPHGLGEAWQWGVRDVVAGSDVASGFAPSFEEARDAAGRELDRAQQAEAVRLVRELGAQGVEPDRLEDEDLDAARVRAMIAERDRAEEGEEPG